MGGRGSSSGISASGKKYGTEYETLHQDGNIKFVRYKDGASKAPMETMSKNRIYATVNNQNEVRNISFYDKDNKRYKQIDLEGKPHIINGVPTLPHTHFGYIHAENGTDKLSKAERRVIDRVKKTWDNFNKSK